LLSPAHKTGASLQAVLDHLRRPADPFAVLLNGSIRTANFSTSTASIREAARNSRRGCRPDLRRCSRRAAMPLYVDSHCDIDRFDRPSQVMRAAEEAVVVTELPSAFQRLSLMVGKRRRSAWHSDAICFELNR
jgi:hypothetical protein